MSVARTPAHSIGGGGVFVCSAGKLAKPDTVIDQRSGDVGGRLKTRSNLLTLNLAKGWLVAEFDDLDGKRLEGAGSHGLLLTVNCSTWYILVPNIGPSMAFGTKKYQMPFVYPVNQ